MLRTSSIVQNISYAPAKIGYTIFDKASKEIFRLTWKPGSVTVNGTALPEVNSEEAEGWVWQALEKGGVLKINQAKGNKIEIVK
jgi:hypothetical protein